MGTVAHAFRSAVEVLLWPFDLLPPWLSLTLVSIITGVVMLWVVGKSTPQRRLERARDRLAGGVYEVRLFLDSPVRIFGALFSMLKWSVIYIGLVIPALLVMTFPLGLLYLHLETRHGFAPLPVGEPLVVRVDLADGVDGYALEAGDEGGNDVLVTAPPVYDAEGQRVYLRVEVQRPGEHVLPIRLGDTVVDKRLTATADAVTVSPDRASGADMFLVYTDEPPLDAGAGITAVSVTHPAKDQSWLGTSMPWWVFWLGIATVAALALRRPMGVVL